MERDGGSQGSRFHGTGRIPSPDRDQSPDCEGGFNASYPTKQPQLEPSLDSRRDRSRDNSIADCGLGIGIESCDCRVCGPDLRV